jgi:pyruvate,orthophosphate dikinase
MTTNAPAASSFRLTNLGEVAPERMDPAVVGAKAANLMKLSGAGLAVPPGFVLGTQVCADYNRLERLPDGLPGLIARGIAEIESDTGRRFGGPRKPLLVSVRSGAPVSMPGMLETILNIGLCDASVPGLLRATGDPWFVWDSYRRLVQSYGAVVGGCPDAPFADEIERAVARSGAFHVSELDVAALEDLVLRLQAVYQTHVGQPFPQDPQEQLLAAVEAVLRSWNAERAVRYRRLEGLSTVVGTAVTVQAMVFGNLASRSGAGVAFTRNPATGERELYIDFLADSQGEDVVAGTQAVLDTQVMIEAVPGLAAQLESVSAALEDIFRDAQDFEFTVEDGGLWLLQTRTAKRTPLAALRIACDLVDEGRIDTQAALDRLRSYDLDSITVTELVGAAECEPLGRATTASNGVASGRIALDVETALKLKAQGDPVVLVRETVSTQDIAALAVCRGLLTASGARTSHGAVIARQLGIVCLVNCADLAIDLVARCLSIGGRALDEGELITLDASTGVIYEGALEVSERQATELVRKVRAWQSGRP